MRRPVLATLAVLATMTAPLAAQPVAGTDPAHEVVVQLSKLNATLVEVQEFLERQLETQTLDLLLKRSQLASAEVFRLSTQLRQATTRRDSLEDDRVRMELRSELLEERDRSGTAEQTSEEIDTIRRQLRVSMNMAESRLREVEAEIVDLDSRLFRKQEDLQSWQDLLDRRLSGF